ncbi:MULTISPECIES: peptidylprolyl isomerase [unclassified Sphingomonas]|uniref:peptidylprolyl isomerase n=1 Tax=unclassified Sphingomonas TaxID=196159 RepID=UPI0009287211|nr:MULTISPECIES: peptidylprolyl isomerase [unclassified Sphingomonas]MBN8849947.1 peptidylprolyl isomerase [Sphingomonas sp.]OJV28659.1 MAG: peptidylprolyl isomerase [Sphingomonas sp. 67-36]
MIATILTLLGMALAPAAAPSSPQQAPSEIAAAAPVRDWRAIAESDLLVMDLAPDRAGRPRRVVIQLMPAPFSQAWIGNIRRLAAAHWWDGAAINRVQDDYVAQWGGDTAKHPVPAGLATTSQADYVADLGRTAVDGALLHEVATRRIVGRLATAGHDPYAPLTFTWRGWPIAAEQSATGATTAWPVHCYGMVGVGRDMPPDAGSGAELYAVIGHAPRHLDRNIALVGRVIEGIELLSALPRGTEALGMYVSEAERVPIVSIRMASELPAAERPRYEYLATESDSFARYADARANRRDGFFIRPAGGADICNVPTPVRRTTR